MTGAMSPRDNNAAEEAAARHLVSILGGEFTINDTGAEPGQYDIHLTTPEGASIALEVTSFGGDDWRRTAARVEAAQAKQSFAGEGLARSWWVVFRSGADLRPMEEPLTELLQRLEREGRDRATERYEGDEPTLREVAQLLRDLNISGVQVWDVGLDEDAPRILLSQSQTWVGGVGDLVAALTALFQKRDNQEKLARAQVDERHLYVFMEDGGASAVLDGAWPLPACPPDPEGSVDMLWVYSASASGIVFRVRPGTEDWEKFSSLTGQPV
jgi:hypothetical protein